MSMLRAAVLVFAIGMLAAGLWLFATMPSPRVPAIYLLCSGGILLLGTAFERRYQKRAPRNAQWRPTGERFVDPQTGANVEVLYDPESGERHYSSTPGDGTHSAP